MTTVVDFVPSLSAPFQFQPTLDNDVYTIIITWNLMGQRYYVNCYSLDGTLIFCLPLIGSPPGYDISLTAGYFTSTMVYRVQSRQFEIAP